MLLIHVQCMSLHQPYNLFTLHFTLRWYRFHVLCDDPPPSPTGWWHYYVTSVCYNLGQNGWIIKTTPPPISMMEKWRVFVVARVHHWIGGRGTPISHFILSRIVGLNDQSFPDVDWITVWLFVLFCPFTKKYIHKTSISKARKPWEAKIKFVIFTQLHF